MANADVTMNAPEAPRRNTKLYWALGLVAFVWVMVGASFAAVPLYYAFCAATGYGGTTQQATSNPKGAISREMTTRFDATVSKGLPIMVRAARPATHPIGTVQTIEYVATNPTARPIKTTASFNVTPERAGVYFNKIDCFCFTEQTLQPGETVKMPVTFFVDPDIDKNKDLRTVRDITLSYTFYAAD